MASRRLLLSSDTADVLVRITIYANFTRTVSLPTLTVAEKTFLNMRALASAHPDMHFTAVSHSDQPSTDRWLASLPDPSQNTQPNLSIVVDAEREAYAAWGLGVSSLWHVLGSIPGTTKLKQDGISVRPTESGSRWQTAGNFGVDAQGIVRWARVDQRADDMPDFTEGLDKVRGGRFEAVGVGEAMQG
jgi:hypothetical protein